MRQSWQPSPQSIFESRLFPLKPWISWKIDLILELRLPPKDGLATFDIIYQIPLGLSSNVGRTFHVSLKTLENPCLFGVRYLPPTPASHRSFFLILPELEGNSYLPRVFDHTDSLSITSPRQLQPTHLVNSSTFPQIPPSSTFSSSSYSSFNHTTFQFLHHRQHLASHLGVLSAAILHHLSDLAPIFIWTSNFLFLLCDSSELRGVTSSSI